MAHRPNLMKRLMMAATMAMLAGPAIVAGCGVEERVDEAEQQANKLSATDVKLTMSPRVLPSGGTYVEVQATLAGVSDPSAVVLRFKGDASWGGADLPGLSKNKGRFTFGKTITAPARIGVHDLSWQFEVIASQKTFGPEVAGKIEVTCSDGLFCNGEERLTSRGCVAGPPPCDDGVACTDDICDEAQKTCVYQPNGPSCATCSSKNCNPKCGPHDQCGDDGCGGKCVSAATDAAGSCLGGQFCVDRTCQSVSLPGTCNNPLPLFGAAGFAVPDAGIVTTQTGDSSAGIDALKVSCGAAGIKELIYRFDVGVKMGAEIRVLAASGDPDALDTVAAIHKDDCVTQGPWPGFCSDDASPPGGLGSRVYGPLDPGSYRLVVTGYSASQVGPFQLQIKFVPGCTPACDGKYCGPDGCGGQCGACGAGQECSALGKCFTAPCTPSCTGGRKCGDDGCGGSCGACAAGEICAEADGKCVSASGCDHLKPVCKNCGPKSYCGTDCACHPVSETLIDLIPARENVLLPSIEFEWRTFDNASCALAEGCVPGPGRWLLMRFTTDINNQGLAGFKPGDPTQLPELFDYHACHQHYHFVGFANYSLYRWDGVTMQTGRKLSYCMEDSYQYLMGPNIPCAGGSTCDDQGIQAGWADSYPSTLDCQWIVLRGATPSANDVPSGQWYWHETCTNQGRTFHEHSFDNNCYRIPVYVPDVPDTGLVVKYSDLSLPPLP